MAIVCFLIAAIYGLHAYIDYETSEYAVTNRRILMKTGWIRRSTLELFLTKIEALHIDQSVLVRPFDPYDRLSKKIYFNPEIQRICNDIFPIFVEIRKKDIFASASMASYLFEQFTNYWNSLLHIL